MSRFESPKVNVNVGAAKVIVIVIIALIVIGVAPPTPGANIRQSLGPGTPSSASSRVR